MLRTSFCDADRHTQCPGAGHVNGTIELDDASHLVEVRVPCGCECHYPDVPPGVAATEELARQERSVRSAARAAAIQALVRAGERRADTGELERIADVVIDEVWPIITRQADLFATNGSRLAHVMGEVQRLAGQGTDRRWRRP